MANELEDTKKTYKVDTLEEAVTLLNEHELQNALRFSTIYGTKDFGSTDLYLKNHKILWQDDEVEYSGVPFVVVNFKRFDCQYGFDRDKMKRIKRNREKEALKKQVHGFKFVKTKKVDCPAQVKMKEILEFPEHAISSNTKHRRVQASKCVREMIARKSALFARKIIITIPAVNQHKYHKVGSDDCLDISDNNVEFASLLGQEKNTQNGDSAFCRLLLDDIRRLTFHIEDQPRLITQLHDHLTNLRNELNKAVPGEKRIPLRKKAARSKVKNSGNIKDGKIMMTLSLRKRKGQFVGSVGKRNEKSRRLVNLRANYEDDEQHDTENEMILATCGATLELQSKDGGFTRI